MPRLVTAALLAGLAACPGPVTPIAEAPEGCIVAQDCPEAYRCLAGACVYFPSDSDGGLFGDAGPETDAGAPPPYASCAVDPDTWANYAGPWYQANCLSCHAPAPSGIGARPTLETLAQVLSARRAVERQLGLGYMPPQGGLSAADLARMQQWLACQADAGM